MVPAPSCACRPVAKTSDRLYFAATRSDITYAVTCHISASVNTSRQAGIRSPPRSCPSAMAENTYFGSPRSRLVKLTPPSPFAPWQWEQCFSRNTCRPAEITAGSFRSGASASPACTSPGMFKSSNAIAAVTIRGNFATWGGGLLIAESEGDQGRRRRHVFERWKERRQEDRRVGAPAAWHQDVLLAIHGVADEAAAQP